MGLGGLTGWFILFTAIWLPPGYVAQQMGSVALALLALFFMMLYISPTVGILLLIFGKRYTGGY